METKHRIRWAVELLKRDLEKSDLKNLREELLNWFYGPTKKDVPHLDGILSHPMKAPFPQDFTLDDFRELKEGVNGLTTGLVSSLSPMIPISISVGAFGDQTCTHLYASGPTRDIFLFIFSLLLKEGGGAWILECQECESIFFRTGKHQLFCGSKCRNKVMQRRWRERHRQEEAGRRRKKYVKKVKEKNGQNVKVGTNKRRK